MIMHKGLWLGERVRRCKLSRGSCYHYGLLEDHCHHFIRCKKARELWKYARQIGRTQNTRVDLDEVLVGELGRGGSKCIPDAVIWVLWVCKCSQLYAKKVLDQSSLFRQSCLQLLYVSRGRCCIVGLALCSIAVEKGSVYSLHVGSHTLALRGMLRKS